jgi:ketosteroid isomerase-like protein
MNYLRRCFSLAAVLCIVFLVAQCGRAENSIRQAAAAAPETENSKAVATIRALEERVEEATVSGDTAFLEKVFGDDFTYARTTGEVENKAQWLQHVARKPFLSRKIVAMDIEIHGDVAVVHGQLDMAVHDDHGGHGNLVKYLRVYQQRNGQWQILTHRSLEETAKPVT